MNKITKLKNFNLLKGVVIGRSDFVGSLNKEKSHVDSHILQSRFKIIKENKKKYFN